MRIKNESKRMFCFNGGCIAPGKVVDIQDTAVAEALIKGYVGELTSLDDVEVEVIPAAPAPVEEAPAEEEEVKTSRKSKKSK